MVTFLFNNENSITMIDKYKILVILLVILTMAITSCKEDEEVVLGCTDSNAINYLFNATSNDGSCIYAYEIAQGTWDLTPDCSDLPIPIPIPGFSVNDLIPESIDVDGGGGDTLYIDMNGSKFSGIIDSEGNILVDEQTISIDFSGAPIPVQVSGEGMIESADLGYMDLKYSGLIDFIPDLPIPVPFSITCHIDLER